LTQIGGPGHLIVYNDTAVVLEKAGRLTRVESGGFPCLEPFERIYEVIDLRPKQYNYRVSAITQDGIPIHWDVKVRYQIDQGDKEPTPEDPYPFSEDAVLNAATRKWHREPSWRFGQDMDWEGMVVVSRAEGALRSILARYTLDRLIGVRPGEEQAVREEIQGKLKGKLDTEAPNFGAKILEVRLDNLGVEDHVTQQWIKAWKSRWQRWAAGRLAPGEATYVYLQEVAKAEAQIRLVRSITEALGRQMAGDRISPQMVNRIVLLRLFSVMDRAGFAASARVFFPNSAADMLERMRGMLAGDAAKPPAELTDQNREEET
jgi:regulator of protease activity HflC (stomatin/prohibitin superfamily)